jgi:hypothetical protein
MVSLCCSRCLADVSAVHGTLDTTPAHYDDRASTVRTGARNDRSIAPVYHGEHLFLANSSERPSFIVLVRLFGTAALPDSFIPPQALPAQKELTRDIEEKPWCSDATALTGAVFGLQAWAAFVILLIGRTVLVCHEFHLR